MRSSVTVVGELKAETPVNIAWGSRNWRVFRVKLDDRLRSVPGFSLFPPVQFAGGKSHDTGISLRGIGSSGASRTLLLWDGVPVNDPFGGWVYWTRFSPEQMDRVEVMRSASTSVFGDRAMGGAIGLFSQPADHRRYQLGFEAGNYAKAC